MNDLIKDIAKIAELPYKDGKVKYSGDWIDPLLDSMRAKALRNELMVIYKVGLRFQSCGFIDAYVYGNYKITDTSPNKVIFLAIRESNKDKL